MGIINRKMGSIYLKKALTDKNPISMNEHLNKVVEYTTSKKDAKHVYSSLLSAINSAPEYLNLFVETMNQIREKSGENVIYDDVNLKNMGLTKLPDFSKFIVYGKFDCSYNKLSDLIGAPAAIEGDPIRYSFAEDEYIAGRNNFYARNNNLLTLKGAPSYVRGSFDVSNNKLKNLEGAPEQIRHILDCRGNPVLSLSGAKGVGCIKFDTFDIKNIDEAVANGPYGNYVGGPFIVRRYKKFPDDANWEEAEKHAAERLKENKEIVPEYNINRLKKAKDIRTH